MKVCTKIDRECCLCDTVRMQLQDNTGKQKHLSGKNIRLMKWGKVVGSAFLMLTIFFGGWYFGAHGLITNAQTSAVASVAASTSTSSHKTFVQTITLALNPDVQPSGVNISKLWRTWNLLNNNFVQTRASSTIPSDTDKMNAMIAGLVGSYGDPYTVFMLPSDATTFNQDVTGSFGGLGMEIGNDKDGNLVVIAPLKGNPAEAAGILSGDKIIAINSTSSAQMSSDKAVKLIRGPMGSTVKLTLKRIGENDNREISVVRGNVIIPNIKTSYNAGTRIFEIDLYSFSAVSADNFRDALREYMKSGANKLLLDLRGNPGGYLDAAVNMASYFLPTGKTVVTEDYQGKQDNVVHSSLGYNIFAGQNMKMAILVDQGTASASEILSGALQQNGVAILVGNRTFGKGCVQEMFDLGDGSQVKVTVARWLTPNGSSISDGGLTPDIFATTTMADLSAGHDPQKEAASAWLETH